MKTKKFLFTAMVLGILLTWTTASRAEGKVGFINLQRLINESTLGKTARAEIRKLRKEKESALAGKLMEVNRLKEDVNKEVENPAPTERRQRQDALNKAYKEYQRLAADAREDIIKEDKELVAVILQKADKVLKRVAREKGYTIILKDPNAVGYLDPTVDITDDVLAALDNTQKKD